MADWVGHVLFAATIALFLKTDKKSLVYFGALLPDLFSKVVLLSIFWEIPRDILDAFFYPSHSLLGAMIISSLFGIIISAVCKQDIRQSILLILIGSVSHLLLDLFNHHFMQNRGAVLFPLLTNFEVPWLLPNEYLWFWTILIPLYIVCRMITSMAGRLSRATNRRTF